jgi:hypothetical protein
MAVSREGQARRKTGALLLWIWGCLLGSEYGARDASSHGWFGPAQKMTVERAGQTVGSPFARARERLSHGDGTVIVPSQGAWRQAYPDSGALCE